MHKKVILVTVICLVLSAATFGQTRVDTYSKATSWAKNSDDGKSEVGGQLRTRVTLERIKDGFHICVQRDMTPFSEVMTFETDAILRNGIYIFSCFDNWGNHVFGFIRFDEKICVFYLDCKDFSEKGKSIGRLFVNSQRLEKGNIAF